MEKFSQLPYQRPDYRDLAKRVRKAAADVRKAKTYAEFIDAFKRGEEVIKTDYTATTLVAIRNDMNKKDAFYQNERDTLDGLSSKLTLACAGFYKALLASSFRPEFEAEYGPFVLKKVETTLRLTKVFSVLLGIREKKLVSRYSKTIAQCSCQFDGKECNFYGLLAYMESPDRSVREAAFEKWSEMLESAALALEKIYDQLVPLRLKIARSLGFDNFFDYIFTKRERYDYGLKEIENFREAVVRYIVPVCERIQKQQKALLNLDQLEYYDEKLYFAQGNPNPIGTVEELVDTAQAMYRELSRETGEYFDFMKEHELYDLPSRLNKHMGGYCEFLPDYQAPFIFANFNGTSADSDVLTHEAGHAFQCYRSALTQKTMLTLSSSSEINEIHSMAMEHFTYPWMEGFFKDRAKEHVWVHLADSLLTIPYLCAVDEYQQKVYRHPEITGAKRRQLWKETEARYLPNRHYGNSAFLNEGGFWMQKQHIFMYPFYYIEYALAQICAYQFYLDDQKDHKDAFSRYVKLCDLGGSMGYLDLLSQVGLKSPFEEETLKEVVAKIVEKLDELEKEMK